MRAAVSAVLVGVGACLVVGLHGGVRLLWRNRLFQHGVSRERAAAALAVLALTVVDLFVGASLWLDGGAGDSSVNNAGAIVLTLASVLAICWASVMAFALLWIALAYWAGMVDEYKRSPTKRNDNRFSSLPCYAFLPEDFQVENSVLGRACLGAAAVHENQSPDGPDAGPQLLLSPAPGRNRQGVQDFEADLQRIQLSAVPLATGGGQNQDQKAEVEAKAGAATDKSDGEGEGEAKTGAYAGAPASTTTTRQVHVLSLLEDEEFRLMGYQSKEEWTRRAAAAGVQCTVREMRDKWVPRDMGPFVLFVVDSILAPLSSSCRVLVHCFGGCGRTGTAAGTLMVLLGHSAWDAIWLVRRRRPGALKNWFQRYFLYEMQTFLEPVLQRVRSGDIESVDQLREELVAEMRAQGLLPISSAEID